MGEALSVRSLSREAFAPFGDVLETDGAEPRLINEGTTERFHALARAELIADGAAIISIFRGQPRAFPYSVTMMERHPLGSPGW